MARTNHASAAAKRNVSRARRRRPAAPSISTSVTSSGSALDALVGHQAVEQVAVEPRDARDVGSTPAARRNGAVGPLSTSPRTNGLTATTGRGRRPAPRACPATARIGPIEMTGLLGPMTTASASAIASATSGVIVACSAPRTSIRPTSGRRALPPRADHPLLERRPVDPGADGLVAHRQHAGGDAERRAQRVERLRQPLAGAQPRARRSRQISRSSSPRLNQTSSPRARSRSMAWNVSPSRPQPRASMRSASQNSDQVRVGGDVGAVDLDVVAGVGHDDQLVADDVEHPARELRAAGAAGEDDDRSTAGRTRAGASRRTPARPRAKSAVRAQTVLQRDLELERGGQRRARADASITRLASPTATGAHSSSSSTSCCVAASSSSAGATRLTRPMRSASVPSISLPVRISSLARPRPTTCGSRDEPPTSGIRPMRVSGRPVIASAAIDAQVAGQRGLQRAADAAAVDLADDALGHLLERLARPASACGTAAAATCRRRRPWPASSLRSTPEENIGPAPRSTTTWTSASAAMSRSASPSAAISSRVERVALLRAVEDDVADPPVVLVSTRSCSCAQPYAARLALWATRERAARAVRARRPRGRGLTIPARPRTPPARRAPARDRHHAGGSRPG